MGAARHGEAGVSGVGFAVALVVLGALTAGVLLLVCSAFQTLVGLVWERGRAPQFGITVAVLLPCAVWALIAVSALIERWQQIVYFGLIGFGMVLVAVPRIWHLNRRRRHSIASVGGHGAIER